MEIEFKMINDTSLKTHTSINYSQVYPLLVTSTQQTSNLSNNLTDSSDRAFCDTYTFVHYSIIVPILVILGLIGNTVSFFIFGKDKVKTSTIFLFQSLAVVDNILLVAVVPVYSIPAFYAYYFKAESDIISDVIDAFVFPFAILAQTVTVWLTVLVAFNRYVAVCKPYKAARLCTVRQAKCQLTVVVICSIIFNLPKFFQPTLSLETRPDNTTHYVISARDFMTDPIYINVYESALYFIVMLFLPLLVLNILNVKLVRALKKLNRKRIDMVQNARQKNDNNVTLVLIIVVVVFVICQVPALANRLMWSFLPNSSRECKGLHFFVPIHSNIFAVTNSSINFVIYMAFNPRFRQTVLESSCCLFFTPYFRRDSNLNTRNSRPFVDSDNHENDNIHSFNCFKRLTSHSSNDTHTKTTSVNLSQLKYKKSKAYLLKGDTKDDVGKEKIEENQNSVGIPLETLNKDNNSKRISITKQNTNDNNGNAN